MSGNKRRVNRVKELVTGFVERSGQTRGQNVHLLLQVRSVLLLLEPDELAEITPWLNSLTHRHRETAFEPLLRCFYAAALICGGRRPEADRIVSALLEKERDDPCALVLQVDLCLWKEDPEGAFDAARRGFELQPDSEFFARKLAAMHLEAGRPSDAIETLERGTAARSDTALVADLARAYFKAGDHAQALHQAERASRAKPGPNFAHNIFLQLLDQSLRGHQIAFAARILELLLDRETLPDEVVKRLHKLVEQSCDADFLATMPAALTKRYGGIGDILARARVELSQIGPETALATVRAAAGERSHAKALFIAEALCAMGRAATAFRYLRLATRTWPKEDDLKLSCVNAAIEAGQADLGHRFLDGLAREPRHHSDRAIIRCRAELLTAEGRLSETEACIALLEGSGESSRPILQRHLRLLLARGALKEAEKVANLMRHTMKKGSPAEAHFNVRFFGAELNELRLCKIAEKDLPSGWSDAHKQRDLALGFFFPASQIVTSAAPGDRFGTPVTGRIPRRIMQYWNDEKIPATVAQHCSSWAQLDGFEYVRFSRKSAIAWLGSTFDPDHVRAFRAAQQPAQESDFLRLCWLVHEGGIYVDADDRLVGDMETILGWANDALFFMEPMRALANNFIAARAGHPVLQWAKNAALESLLSRENDRTWAKTGPGLLTRAAAAFLSDCDPRKLQKDLRILPLQQLKREVAVTLPLPHKLTARHWNSNKNSLPKPLEAAFRKKLSGELSSTAETHVELRSCGHGSRDDERGEKQDTLQSVRLFPKNLGADRYEITGIASRCDWVVLSDNKPPEVALIRRSATWAPRHIFLSLRNPQKALNYFASEILPLMTRPFVLITGSEDVTLPRQTDHRFARFDGRTRQAIRMILEHPGLQHWFAENLDDLFNPRVSALPTGFVFSDTSPPPVIESLKVPLLASRRQWVLYGHRIRKGPQWEQRKRALEFALADWRPFTTVLNGEVPIETYRALMQTHSFVLCVEGGGLDPAPRAFEAILHGAIPIIRRTATWDAYRHLPCIAVESWSPESINTQKLAQWRQELTPEYDDPDRRKAVLRKLTLDYWWEIVENAAGAGGTVFPSRSSS